jgi:hypothetical protein
MHRVKTLDPSTPAARDLERGRFVIRRMDAADMASIAIPWMTEAGWNPGYTTRRRSAPPIPTASSWGCSTASRSRRRGMSQAFATARMYTGPAPAIDLGRVFGVTTFELG